MEDSRIKNISSLLSAFFNNETIRQGRHYAEVFGAWKQIAGERLAAHSRVVEIEKGFLIVAAEHPGWIQLLQLRQTELLDSVRIRFPGLALRGIVFRLENGDAPSKSADARGRQEHMDPREDEAETGIAEPNPAVPSAKEELSWPVLDVFWEKDIKSTLERLREAVNEAAGRKRR